MSAVQYDVAVVGLGYIGLPTAAMLADRGMHVLGIDKNPEIVAKVNRGEIHIFEPDLDKAVFRAHKSKALVASTAPSPAQVFMIAVPTPFTEHAYTPDLSYIESAIKLIAPQVAAGNLIVLESTSPVGATERMAEWLREARADLFSVGTGIAEPAVYIAHCPERVLPGNVMTELVENDRIIGGLNRESGQVAQAFYQKFVRGECLVTDARTAELSKLVENSFRDVNIAFANELSIICDRLNVDVWRLIELANHHPRVNILQPGAGVGGHCIAVDPWFIVSSAPESAKLIKTARMVNDGKPEWVLNKVAESISRAEAGGNAVSTIACYGLSFKPNIDDLRESPALEIAKCVALQHSDKSVLIVEPFIDSLPFSSTNTRLVTEVKARETADIHVLLVDHSQFSRKKPGQGEIVDTRGMWQS